METAITETSAITMKLPFEVREMTAEVVKSVEEILGYKFNSRSLASEALTHASYFKGGFSEIRNLDRLEFLGDSVLGLLVARELFSIYPSLDSGKLTQLRSANVDTEKLARAAINHGLHQHLRHGISELEDKIQKFMESAKEYPLHSYGILDPPKVLADFVESVLGAIFLDSNYSLDTVWKVLLRLAEPLITVETLRKHPVPELYEFCQKRKLKPKFLKDKLKKYGIVKVLIDDKFIGKGVYAPKKDIAQNRAAKDTIDKLKLEELAKHDLTRAPEESEEVDQNCVSKNDMDKPKEETEGDLNHPAKVKVDKSDNELGKPDVEASKNELDYPAKQVSTEFDMNQRTQNELDKWTEVTLKLESTKLVLNEPSDEGLDKAKDVSMEEESTEFDRKHQANESLDKAKDVSFEEELTEFDRIRPAKEKLDHHKWKTGNLTKTDLNLEVDVELTELDLNIPSKDDEKSDKLKEESTYLDLNLNLSSKLDKLKKESTEAELISAAKLVP